MMLAKLSVRTTHAYHAALAEELAGRHGLVVDISWPRDPLPGPGNADGLVYDIDFLGLDARGRRELAARLATAPVWLPTGVFGWGLEDADADALRGNGIVVARRLEDAFVAALAARILGRPGAAAA